MGFSGVSMGSLLVILLIVMVIFGTKRLRNIGEDLGAAVKGFRQGMQDAERDSSAQNDEKHGDSEKLEAPKNHV